ncbi:hypothetical protein B2J86_09060 [Acidovorax sp. SRB_14]|uniref:hypothetical protein n=1 Tax=Acidovorax sp. SRB_14 TaxID=1962699 RepID=UPI00156409A6|nr:hypothetical protein [Acidovorax sp. SRB_14]NMM81068.1 hypothetical protein [Acidovorax sp. SRB_14]
MRTTVLLTAMALLATALSAPALAGDHRRDRKHAPEQAAAARCADGLDRGMQAVPHHAAPQERAYGWQYFSDPQACRAVVISPQGDYYLSLGKGLRWVAGAQTQV